MDTKLVPASLVWMPLLFLAAVFYLSLHPDRPPEQLHSRDPSPLQQQQLLLQRSLEAAAFRNRTVIITFLNRAWAENGSMIDLFLESFQQGNGTQQLLQHLLIVNLDAAAQRRCSQLHAHCFSITTNGVDFQGEQVFMTPDYLKMVWRRIDFLREVLELGFSFVFSDADILWLRDPFPQLSDEWDIEVSSDKYNGNETDLENHMNSGFMHTVANARTVELYKLWYLARLGRPGEATQPVFNAIKRGDEFSELGLKLRFLDTRYIASFCQARSSLSSAFTMHGNCCTGLARKLFDLRLILQDWRRFQEQQQQQQQQMNGSSSNDIRWSAPRECLHFRKKISRKP